MLGINRAFSTLMVKGQIVTAIAFGTSFILREKANISWWPKSVSKRKLRSSSSPHLLKGGSRCGSTTRLLHPLKNGSKPAEAPSEFPCQPL